VAPISSHNAAIGDMLPRAGSVGWHAAFGGADAVTARLFPGGATEIVEAYLDLMDRRMIESAMPRLSGLRLTGRVHALIQARLEVVEPHKQVVRRTVLYLALPAHAALAARCMARTVDAVWHAAGDTSADMSWYTKRAILTGVYTSTLLYWLHGDTGTDAALAFLDRRLALVARIGRLRGRMTRALHGHAAA
jgi:ubiquinone biosynthesis protein COQ9